MTSCFQVRIRILSREVEYLFWVWMNSEKVVNDCKQAIIKLSLACSFRKMFFIGQNLNFLTWHLLFLNFDLLLINWSRYLSLEVYFSPRHRNIASVNTNSKGNHSWNKNKHFDLFFSWNKNEHFHLLKFLMNNFYFFSVSWTHFQKQPFADVLLSALKDLALF